MVQTSIIIRTKNEEKWIKHCLQMIHSQSYQDFEVILVDNESTDNTVALAKKVGISKLTTVKHFLPGDAINRGINLSSGQYIVCLSAHCVPRDELWLETLLSGFEDNTIAGTYGRQVPVSFSSDNDKRDLLITFGLDKRVQIKDYFFHNANSAIRRDIWDLVPFDATTTNIEDRLWAKEVVALGHRLIYEPNAAVYHHHGIHQNLEVSRARNIVSILESVEPEDYIHGLPPTMRPENAKITAICPILGDVKNDGPDNLLDKLVRELQSSKYVDTIYLFSENPEVEQLSSKYNVNFMKRPRSLDSNQKTIEHVLKYALNEIESKNEMPDAILYANYLFPNRPIGFFDDLVIDLQHKGLDTVFGGYPDYDNYWLEDSNDGFRMIGDGMRPRQTKRPLYRALYRLGTIASPAQIRDGHLLGDRIGIIAIKDPSFTRKITAPSQ